MKKDIVERLTAQLDSEDCDMVDLLNLLEESRDEIKRLRVSLLESRGFTVTYIDA